MFDIFDRTGAVRLFRKKQNMVKYIKKEEPKIKNNNIHLFVEIVIKDF